MCLTERGAPPSSAVPFEKVAGASAVFAAAAEAAIRARGTFDPRAITEGTIAYLFRFDSGFTLISRNSAGPITDHGREAMARVRRTEPLFMAIRDSRPQTTTISPLYREPVCSTWAGGSAERPVRRRLPEPSPPGDGSPSTSRAPGGRACASGTTRPGRGWTRRGG